MTARSITLELHWPPSVNQSYMGDRQGRGRLVKKPEARQWMKDAVLLLLYQKPVAWKALQGPLRAVVEFCPPNNRSDLDNRFKPVFDAIEQAGIIENDRQIKRIEADMLDGKKPGFVRLSLSSLGDRVRK